jgi:hypothetical protein
VGLDQLRAELGTAAIIDGETASATLSAAEARRLACTAQIVPVDNGDLRSTRRR